MAVPTTILWSLDPHTLAKHRILRSYLDAWLPIMARWNEKIVFIDGFAGPGRYEGGEDGSPLIALRAVLEHAQLQQVSRTATITFIFVERERDRHENLVAEIDALRNSHPFPSWLKVTTRCGEFAPVVTAMLDDAATHKRPLPPFFAFVDPFGFSGVPISLLARIIHIPRSECLMSFMYESINRFLAVPNAENQKHFDELFGVGTWRAIMAINAPAERREGLVALYTEQLREVAGLKYVRTFEMINDGNRTEYFLFFGTNSLEGLSKMKQAMWRADPQSGAVFSDRTNPMQTVLIGVAQASQLGHILNRRYKGAGVVRIEDVINFVLVETPYSEVMHLKKMTLAKMEKAGAVRAVRPEGKRNRAGDYPEGTVVEFL